jgi:hypothetical protein
MKPIARLELLFLVFLSACATATPTAPAVIEQTSQPQPGPIILDPNDPPPRNAELEFSTDFSQHSIPYNEILSGGPPKDGIPALDQPQFVSIQEADSWLRDPEPVILVQVGDDARAYPIQILMWHEIVNDTVGGEPLIVTFCPLCNTAIAFKRTVNGQILDFGTTGRLRYSNLIMYDRQTETWWQQATGDAIVGELLGAQLEFYPAVIIAWEEFVSQFPDGKVLSQETGFNREYGRNPYFGYDDINGSPFLYDGPATPNQLPPIARVLTVELNNEAVAYPYETLSGVHVVNDSVGGDEIVVIWQAGVASPLDRRDTATGRDVGTGAAFSREVNGNILTFTFDNANIKDDQTNSTWDIFGKATAGELTGSQLSPVVAINHFWFSWAAFKPETTIYHP